MTYTVSSGTLNPTQLNSTYPWKWERTWEWLAAVGRDKSITFSHFLTQIKLTRLRILLEERSVLVLAQFTHLYFKFDFHLFLIPKRHQTTYLTGNLAHWMYSVNCLYKCHG